MAQTFNTILSFVKSTSRKDRRKGIGSLSVSAVAGGGVGNIADSATQAWVRNNFVDKTTEQEITAPKIFSQGIKIGDVPLFKHPDGYVYLDETLVLKGGVVMFGNSSGVDVPSIFDSLPIDGRTIKRDGNGALYVDETALSISGGGGGGGVADSVHWNNVTGKPSWIGSTKPTYKYSEIEERPDLSVYFLASNFTKANIKSTLGISDWALASAKPTYKYSEISNTPDLSVYAKTSDIPSLSGYATQTWVENKGYLLATAASNTYQPKITSSNKLAYSLISGTPDLSIYALKTAIPTKLSQLTDDVVSGKYLSLSKFQVAEVENPSTVYLQSGIYRQSTSAYFAPGTTGWSQFITLFAGGDNWAQMYFSYDGRLHYRVATFGDGNPENIAWKAIITEKNIGNYNAGSATKLATARTIWGQSFDGTGNLMSDNGVGLMSATQYYGFSVLSDNSIYGVRTFLTYDEGVSMGAYEIAASYYAGGLAISVATGLSYDTQTIPTSAVYTPAVVIKSNGNVAIGGTTADAKLHVRGDAKFTGDTTFSSKVIIGTIPVCRSADGTLFVDANVVFRGGVAMYGDETTTINEE